MNSEDSKPPLNLKTFTKTSNRNWVTQWYVNSEGYFTESETVADIVASEKRFSAAELSAEYWRANGSSRIRAYFYDEDSNIIDIRGYGWEYEHEVLLRFATLPHYDEE